MPDGAQDGAGSSDTGLVVPPGEGARGESTPRPTPSPAMRASVEKWWKETNSVPDFSRCVRAWQESQKTQFPQWFDRNDRFRGRIPQELRTRRDDRRVRLNLCYKRVAKTVAMTVPDDHSTAWEPKPQAVIGTKIPETDPVRRFAQTLEIVLKTYEDEIGFQDIIEGVVQDACAFPAAIVKVTFDKSFIDDCLHSYAFGQDSQENVERLRVMAEDYARNIFSKSDARYKEMMDLAAQLKVEGGELLFRKALNIENIPFNCYRFDNNIRRLEDLHKAAWQSHDALYPQEIVRAMLPWRQGADGQWTGIHPADIENAKRYDETGKALGDDSWMRRSTPTYNMSTILPDGKPFTGERDTDMLLVREVWSRRDNRVFVLVEGVPYLAASYVPVRTTDQWYPFAMIVLNRVFGQVYGISDVELMAEIQHRINRKQSDEEKWRWTGLLPRGIYNTQGLDQQEAIKIGNIPPGELKGINLGGAKTVAENVLMMRFGQGSDLVAFETSKDQRDMDDMSDQPQAFGGTSGGSKFSSEVQAGMAGMQVSSTARGARVRRFLEKIKTMSAQLLLQELEQDDALDIAGPLAHWPKIYSDSEGKQLHDTISQQAKQAAMAQAQVLSGGVQPQPDDPALAEATEQLFRQQCIQTFGFPEPQTRESIFRRLVCKVSVKLNAEQDRQERIQGVNLFAGAILQMAQAATAMGKMLNPKPLLKAAKSLFGADDEIAECFIDPPPMPMMPPGAPGAPVNPSKAPAGGPKAPPPSGAGQPQVPEKAAESASEQPPAMQ